MRDAVSETCSMTFWHGCGWPGTMETSIALETQIDKALNYRM